MTRSSLDPPSQEEIEEILRAHLPELARRYHIKSLGLFGSYVRGAQTVDSDLDLLVEFEKAPTLFELMDLEEELGEILGVGVDLVTRLALKGEIGQQILREVVLV